MIHKKPLTKLDGDHMVIGIKDVMKLFGISIVALCAVFVCSLFLNFNIDLKEIESMISTEFELTMYQAQLMMGKVTSGVTGGCLLITSVVMIVFYIKNYIDTHGKELGILKALGYSDFKVAKNFWVFGMSVLGGCISGYAIAFLYMPTFYKIQNAEELLPTINVSFHPILLLWLVVIPTLFFALISIVYAFKKLHQPSLYLLREIQENKYKISKNDKGEVSFISDLKRTILRSRKTLVFLVAFSAFCFSAMTQMSMSMLQIASESFAFMVITIGLILSFVTMILSLTSIIKANAKTIAMMKVLGYEYKECSQAVLGGYRLFSYIGFCIGTVYQYALLKIILSLVFVDVKNLPTLSFDFKALIISLFAFIVLYEVVMYCYSKKIRKVSIKSIMLE